jgi:hypothetical protein
MVVGFTTTYAISATGWWFSLGTPVSSTTNNDCHDITEILLKVALNTINQTKPSLQLSGRGVQHYVIKFVSVLRQVVGLLWVLRFPPPIKLTATI